MSETYVGPGNEVYPLLTPRDGLTPVTLGERVDRAEEDVAALRREIVRLEGLDLKHRIEGLERASRDAADALAGIRKSVERKLAVAQACLEGQGQRLSALEQPALVRIDVGSADPDRLVIGIEAAMEAALSEGRRSGADEAPSKKPADAARVVYREARQIARDPSNDAATRLWACELLLHLTGQPPRASGGRP